jgi:hypothetical protein
MPVPLRLIVAAVIVTLPAPAAARIPGPSNFAGNPPNFQTCNVCHADFPLNAGDGSLQLLGVPATFVPGETYTLTVQLQDPGQLRWGFEVVIVDPATSFSVGTIVVTDSVHTFVDFYPPGWWFIKHTCCGVYPGVFHGPVTWSFDWVAPAGSPSVAFYYVGNAANGDFTWNGDYIYSGSRQISRQILSANEATTWGRIRSLYAP